MRRSRVSIKHDAECACSVLVQVFAEFAMREVACRPAMAHQRD